MIIQSKRVWFEEKFQPNQIEVEDKKIKGVYQCGLKKVDIYYGNERVLPGLIEIHCHGCLKHDASHAEPEWIRDWMRLLASEGVTSVTPAISTAPEEDILRSLSYFDEVINSGYNGTKIIGIYSEGPFISANDKSAQDIRYRVTPTKEILDKYQKASNSRMKYIMVAPEELDEDMTFIKECIAQNIRVSIGHTTATFEVCAKARDAGATSFTHTYNGMKALNQREAGTVGAAMYFNDMYAELIGDGIHVKKEAATILARLKGKDKLISVTDANRAKGLPTGKVELFGRILNICEDGVARLENGGLAGSTNSIKNILKNEIENFKFPLEIAINSVTCNPAKMLGVDNSIGYIREGYMADIVVLDNDYNVIQTYINGEPFSA